MLTYGDWFTGFGGATIGAMEAGFDIVFGAEYREDVADIYRQNLGDHVKVCDLTKVDVKDFPYVDVFHASPPCPNFSTAKHNAEESENDLLLASKISEYIQLRLPNIFTLENVYKYRKSKSWQMIGKTLLDSGYAFKYWHVNFASYGVPQTRKRMIVVARRDGLRPQLPEATHAKEPKITMFSKQEKWIGWYQAITDLIPSLPESEFAEWQLKRLPDELVTFLPNWNRNSDERCEPHDAIRGMEPLETVPSQKSLSSFRAFIVDGQANNHGDSMTIRSGESPTFTTVASQQKRMPRAFVVSNDTKTCANPRFAHQPQPTITTQTTPSRIKAFLSSGKVVKMTTRALARFQSFPDWYVLPEKNALACYGIGNAVPPLFAQRLYESIKKSIK